jgi:hypothetical protein
MDLTVQDLSGGRIFWEVVLTLPIIAWPAVFFLFRQARGGQDGMGIGRSKAKISLRVSKTSFLMGGMMIQARARGDCGLLKNPKIH